MQNKNTEEKQPTEMEVKYARAVQILNDRNVALETEVGRLTMINRAYEEQFRDMRKVIKELDDELNRKMDLKSNHTK